MTSSLHSATRAFSSFAGLSFLRSYFGLSFIAVDLGICQPLIWAWIARTAGSWGLLEGSGSITAAVGLLAASRRYIDHSIIELVVLRASDVRKSDATEMRNDVLTAKLGLALSVLGNGHLGLGHILWLVEVQLPFGMGVFALRDAHRTKSMYTTAKLPLPRQNSSRRSRNEKPFADVVMECIEFTLEHLHRQDRTEGMSST
jgi:hypothetical protein